MLTCRTTVRCAPFQSALLLPVIMLFGAGGCASAPHSRVAMVVGHSQYEHTAPLPNPANDARAVAGRLAELGWEVILAIDLPVEQLGDKNTEFRHRVANAEQAIFYYAGHGMQVNGQNYMVPIEFDPNDAELQRDLISLNETIDLLKAGDGQLAVFLDACRDNPLALEFEQAHRARTRGLTLGRGQPASGELRVGTGLAELPASAGTFIAYSTAPGHVALDGEGEHSPFTRALLDHMELRNADVGSVLVLVRNQVVVDTEGAQVPWDHSSLTERFWINPKQMSAPPP